jgi:hypothetical protein
MVGGVTRRLMVRGMLAAVVVGPLAVMSAAHAAGPDGVTITGKGLGAPLTLDVGTDPELFASVLSQVSWFATRPGQGHAPKADRLGPKYTVVVLVKGVAKQTYDVYPLAAGGPRAYRPAKQPDGRKTAAGWFYGRLNMPDALRAAGVPLADTPDVLTGGVGGGVDAPAQPPPLADVDTVLGQWRQVLLLNGAVVLVIALGLAGIALLIRRKI